MRWFLYVRQKFFNFLNVVQIYKRKKKCKRLRKKLHNKDFTLISNNCNGCILLHELGLKFNSQFVNLFLSAEDYIKYLENFDYYNSLIPVFDNTTQNYPIGRLKDIKINFVHYKTKEEALKKWEERKKRINKNNFFVIFTEQYGVDGCSEDLLHRFDNLPYRNKIVFTCKKYENIKNSFFCKSYENNPLGVNMFYVFKNKFSVKRKYDIFDFVSWFNGEEDISKLRVLK